jgi:hypothetical protein
MTLNETITAINYIKDIEAENNIKLFILGILFIYSIFMIWLSFHWEPDYFWQKIIKYLILRVPSVVFLFFLPLMSFYLFRQLSYELLYIPLLIVFSYVMLILTLCLFLGMFTWLIEMLGIDTKTKKMEMQQIKKW